MGQHTPPAAGPPPGPGRTPTQGRPQRRVAAATRGCRRGVKVGGTPPAPAVTADLVAARDRVAGEPRRALHRTAAGAERCRRAGSGERRHDAPVAGTRAILEMAFHAAVG